MKMLLRKIHTVLRQIKILLRLIYYQFLVFIWYRPVPFSTKIYGRLRLAHIPCHLVLGSHCGLGHNIFISTGRNACISIGDSVTINDGSMLVASNKIQIGNHVAIGEYVSIRDQQHQHKLGHGVQGQGYIVDPVSIGDNCWIGRGVFIGPGTKLGKDCIVAANSVVHGVFPDGVLIAGAPAVVKKKLALASKERGAS